MSSLYDGAEAVAVLPVSDLERSEAWYGRLGFETLASYDGYRILGVGALHLHLAEQPDLAPGSSPSGVYLYVGDADAVHEAWQALGARIIAPPQDQPYGLREFATEDPDGNLWRIGAPAADPAAGSDSGANAVSDPGADSDPGTGSGSGDDAVTTGSTAASDATPAPGPTDGSPGTDQEHWPAVVAAGRPCAGCGHDPSEGSVSSVAGRIRDEAHRWSTLLGGADDEALRRRPAPGVWSALECAVHTRDVLFVFTERVGRALAEDHPDLVWWDHEGAIEDGYANESDVGAVSDDLVENARRLGEVLDTVQGARWERTAKRLDVTFTVEGLARFTLHEVAHHRVDAERCLAPDAS